jgi:hypothetical protein
MSEVAVASWRSTPNRLYTGVVPRERLGELLLRSGVLTQGQLVHALREQGRTGVRLGQILVDHGMVEEATLYDALAKITGLERFNLRTAVLEKSALNLVTSEWSEEHGMMPYRVDVQHRTLHVAITDPTNLKPIDDLAFKLGLKIKMFVASETEIERIVRHHFFGHPLDRDPRNVGRPGAPMRESVGEIDESQIVHGMEGLRDEVLNQSGDIKKLPEWEDHSGLTDTDRAILAKLKPIYETHEDATRMLRAIFELCIQKGIIQREEYLDRLKKAPD